MIAALYGNADRYSFEQPKYTTLLKMLIVHSMTKSSPSEMRLSSAFKTDSIATTA